MKKRVDFLFYLQKKENFYIGQKWQQKHNNIYMYVEKEGWDGG